MRKTKENIKKDLHSLGICDGDVVLMHSSYKSLGEIEGGAKTFFDAFTELLGDDGTLVVPTLSFESVTRDNPMFDINETPSCVGYLSEYFRTKVPGVLRSMHATHSCCAVGRLAREIIAEHELDVTPVGKNSPFAKLPEYGGKILMLGCNIDRNTSIHGVEETLNLPYGIDRSKPVNYVLKNGDKVINRTSYRHEFTDANGNHIAQCYGRILNLLDDNEFAKGFVLSAECYLMDASAVWKKGHEKLVNDPFYFVEC